MHGELSGADAARDWVDRLLVRLRSNPRLDRGLLLAEVAALSPPVQVGVLRECVRRMPVLRAEGFSAAGSALYDLACRLYARKLPYEESDVCKLLRTSRHACGHGSDVTPPLDIAQAHMRVHGFSEPIVAATREFIDALGGIGSSQVQFAKRRAAIMLLADPAEASGSESGWSAHFRAGLRDLPDAERSEWQRLVLSMKANDVYVQPAIWQKSARRLLAALPPNVVLERIEQWISVGDDPKLRTVRTGGSHVLKHLVWLLGELSSEAEHLPACDTLVVRLSRIDWAPKERAAKFMIAAAYYLSRRPPEVAADALRELARWSGPTPGKIGEIVRRYADQHDLEPEGSLIQRWIGKVIPFRKRSP